jgi:hypothetical protein
MFADLVSVAGHIYKHGIDHGCLSGSSGDKLPINLHADEFNELMGDEFIPLINKGGGAGIQVTAYTQTLSDIEARIGNRAKAGQVIGNFNTLQMLRVRETATAELLTQQLPKVNVLTKTLVSGATDTSDPEANTDFTSSSQDRVSSTSVPLIEPAHIVSLPKGQMFSFQAGGSSGKSVCRCQNPPTTMPCPKTCRSSLSGCGPATTSRRGNGGAQAVAVQRSTSIQIRWGSGPATGFDSAKLGRSRDCINSAVRNGVNDGDFRPEHATTTDPAPGLIISAIGLVLRIIGLLIASLLFSILIEFAGLLLFWGDQGWHTARQC